MPAKHSLHVVLTEPLVRYVRGKVAEGYHLTISDVVRASLRESIALEEARKRHGQPAPIDGFQDGR